MIARIFIDGRWLCIQHTVTIGTARLARKIKPRTNVLYPYHCKKRVLYKRIVLFNKS